MNFSKLKLGYLFCGVLSLAVVSCDNLSYKKTPSGVEYRIAKKGTDQKVKDGDVVTIHFMRYMGDSLLVDTHKGQPEVITYQKTNSGQKYNLLDVFEFAHKGDSIVLRVPMDSIFKSMPQKPPFYKKGGYARINLTIVNIQTTEEKNKENEALRQKMTDDAVKASVTDTAAIKAFVTQQKLSGSFNQQNVFVVVLKEGKGQTIVKDSSVQVKYVGRLLSGKVFDSNMDKKKPLLTFTAGAGQLIPGFDNSIIGLKKGSNVRLIIPSALAYGERGAGDDIPPHSILDFYLEIQ